MCLRVQFGELISDLSVFPPFAVLSTRNSVLIVRPLQADPSRERVGRKFGSQMLQDKVYSLKTHSLNP